MPRKYRIEGWVHPDFAPVAQALEKQLEGTGGGAAVGIYHEGKCVADLWGGTRNPAGAPWQEQTTSVSFSTTKGIASTALHVCADRGLIDYDEPVAEYWPEFAAEGKETITVRHLLCHEAGLYNIRDLIEHAEQMLNWEEMTEILARSKPMHEAGERPAYHALTYGWLIGELVRRVSGKPFPRFVREEIAGPLGLKGLHVGADDEAIGTAARLIPPGKLRKGAAESQGDPVPRGRKAARRRARFLHFAQGVMNVAGLDVDLRHTRLALAPRGIGKIDFSDPRVLQASIPAANGLFDARSLARLYAALANGGELDGARLMSEATLEQARKVQNRRSDRVVIVPMHWRLGWHVPWTSRGGLRGGFGHYGFGGSGAWADPRRKLSMAMVLNSGVGTPFGDLRIGRISTVVVRCADRRHQSLAEAS